METSRKIGFIGVEFMHETIPIITIGDLVKFVLDNRADKVFIGCSELQIAIEIKDGVDNGTLLYSTDPKTHKINGMIIARKLPGNILYVSRNLALNIKNLRRFARYAKQKFPSFTLTWHKHGIAKSPDTNKFYDKLLPA